MSLRRLNLLNAATCNKLEEVELAIRKNILLCITLLFADTLILLAGCDEVSFLANIGDPTADATFWYIAKFQRLEYDNRGRFSTVKERLAQAGESKDVKVMADAMAAAAGEYHSIASHIDQLDAKDVDEEAVAYVQRFNQMHHEAGDLLLAMAEATKAQNRDKMREVETNLMSAFDRVNALDEERTKLFSSLSERYDNRSFNTME